MKTLLFSLAVVASVMASSRAAGTPSAERKTWQVDTPIVTYWAGPALTDAVAEQMVEGGFNLVWCREEHLDIARRHGLRALLQNGLLSPASLDDPAKREQLDSLIDRVKDHPALYAFFLTDEPSAAAFPKWGRLVAHLRERDPAHLAYINLFPTYASNEQLGTQGDVVTAYRDHLGQFVEVVKPDLISYDHYQFAVKRDNDQYFLNLALIQDAAEKAGLPFLNIVQACTWTPSMRVPTPDELRYLVHTSAAYGAQGISYYVYCHPGHTGGIALPDGTPTPLFHELKVANREFVGIARELQTLRLLGAYHSAMREEGCVPLPADGVFRLDTSQSTDRLRGFLLTCFGMSQDQPTHACVVNLDYTTHATAGLIGPGKLQVLDAIPGKWSPAQAVPLEIRLRPGEGRLVRVAP
ncbi:MAG: beta-galactosidase [Verrucomicrobiales bacterium]|nr:beta-galactosidase [Verrucomicrobiales bacterium]